MKLIKDIASNIEKELKHDFVVSIVVMDRNKKKCRYEPIPRTYTENMVCPVCGNQSMFAVFKETRPPKQSEEDIKNKVPPPPYVISKDKTAICSMCLLP